MRQAELAKIWGVSPAYVCKLVGRGMPLASLEKADLWRVDNLEKPPRSESGGAVVRGLCEVVGDDDEGLMEDTIEARVKRCRQVEKLAFQLVRDHAEGGNAIAVRSAIHAHCEAQKRTMEAELVLAKKVQDEEWQNDPKNPFRDWVVPEL
jgi:hypothetical protein